MSDPGLNDPLMLLALVAVGLASGAVNTLAGGGTLITLPALVFFGLPANVANGTNRVGVVLQSLVATWKFRAAGFLEARLGATLLVPSCLGALLGAMISAELDEALFRQVIGGAMLLMLAVMFVKPDRWLKGRGERPPPPAWVAWGAYFAIGVYGGFLQAGVGFFLIAALVLLSGLDLVRANGVKVLLVLAFTLPAMAVFVWQGLVAWGPGLALGLGSMGGGWLGTKMAVTWGPKLVRWVLVAVVAVSAARLLELW